MENANNNNLDEGEIEVNDQQRQQAGDPRQSNRMVPLQGSNQAPQQHHSHSSHSSQRRTNPAARAALREAVLSAVRHPDGEVDSGCLQRAVSQGVHENVILDVAVVARQRDVRDREERRRRRTHQQHQQQQEIQRQQQQHQSQQRPQPQQQSQQHGDALIFPQEKKPANHPESKCKMGSISTKLLALALKRCNSGPLEQIDFDYKDIADKPLAELITALNDVHHNLEKLSLSGNKIGMGGCRALELLLKNPKTKVKVLGIGDNHIDAKCVPILANALAGNNTLKTLDLHYNTSIRGIGWRAFFTCLHKSPNLSLEKLQLYSNNIGDEGAVALAHVLANSTTLKHVDLKDNQDITSMGWQNFFNLLQNSMSPLEGLILSCNNIDDCSAIILANVVSNMSTLKMLYINENHTITAHGWHAIAGQLQNPNSPLEALYICDNNLNDEVIMAFAVALANNAKLKILGIGQSDDITSTGWSALSRTLCNKLSIMHIYNSNHTLQRVCEEEEASTPRDLGLCLQLNQNSNKFEVARQKILQYHFSNENMNIQVFVDMDLKVLPLAIAWICRDDAGRSLLYQLFRSMPSLVGLNNKLQASGAKRKCTAAYLADL